MCYASQIVRTSLGFEAQKIFYNDHVLLDNDAAPEDPSPVDGNGSSVQITSNKGYQIRRINCSLAPVAEP